MLSAGGILPVCIVWRRNRIRSGRQRLRRRRLALNLGTRERSRNGRYIDGLVFERLLVFPASDSDPGVPRTSPPFGLSDCDRRPTLASIRKGARPRWHWESVSGASR